MEASRSTAEEEEVEGEGDGAMEATIVCPAVHFQPKVREGSMEAAGMGILITAARRAAARRAVLRADRRLHRIIKEEGEEVSRAEGACCRRVVAVEGCTAEGSTTVAVMAIRITTIKVAARRIMEEGGSEAQCREAEAEVTQGGRRRGRLW